MDIQDYEKKNIERVYQNAAECTLFLKRDGSFPLDGPCKIAAYGGGVRHTLKGGTGSGDVNSRYFVTVEQGLEDAGFTITTKDWFAAYEKALKDARPSFVKAMKKEARSHHIMPVIYCMGAPMPEPEYPEDLNYEGDCAIYVVSRICGEGMDRKAVKGDYLLTDSEVRDILALDKKFQKFMVVLNVASPMDLTPILGVRNILLLSQLGVPTGTVLADILLGKANPSGKLTASWSDANTYLPKTGFYDTDYEDGIYVGYRYFDSFQKKPLFPFGYGLSYTDFEMKEIKVSNEKEKISVSASIQNVGSYAGKEVVQVYVSCPDGKLKKVYQDLAGFRKTKKLAPNEKEEVRISFSLSDLASYDEERACYFLDKGEYVIRVGNCSDNTVVAALIDLKDEVLTKKAKNIFQGSEVKSFEPSINKQIETEAPVIELTANDFECQEYPVPPLVAVPDEIKKLSDQELAYLNVGFFGGQGSNSVVGESSQGVVGAAGETTGYVRDKIHPALVLSDGPAGIRITQQYYVDKKGTHQISVNNIWDQLSEYAPFGRIVKAFLNKKPHVPEGTDIVYQYTTAIPVGVALAQSWNKDYQYECGDVIGEEMERFGVDIWLAPALNIQRTPLCGRNFEYYSEDPLISGLTAANIVNGVQSHKGCGVSIKHFAANNQETNRYYQSNNVSERTLREIYLRGFVIAIKESNPETIMSSYNLVNGIHTSENMNLINEFLFVENQYQGLVMTDWVSRSMDLTVHRQKYRSPEPSLVAASGHSLFMPGCKGDVKAILKGLKKGTVTRKQLEINAARLYRSMKARQ